LGRLTRFERAHHGATIRCVNRFTTTAMCLYIITKLEKCVNPFFCYLLFLLVLEYMKVKDMNEAERPREKALRFGLKSLTDEELLALMLQSGNKKRSVFAIAKEVLEVSNHLSNLFDLSPNRLMQIQGIREVKALQLLASIELCSRAAKARAYSHVIAVPNDIVQWFKLEYAYEKQEHFVAVYLDTKGKIISHHLLFKGTLNESCVHPRDIFKEAFLENACSVLCIHNHPSGDPQPSEADICCTKQIKEVAQVMGIHFLDHIIVGKEGWYSFRQSQYLD
jgi:DNA repair protein RadC